jgi:hypothetical protein
MRKTRIPARASWWFPSGLFAVLTSLTAGCVPLPVLDSYHKVSADEGQVNGNCLQGSLGPPSQLEFDRAFVHIRIDGDDLSGFTSAPQRTELRITYEMPLGTVVNFDRSQLKVIDLATGQPVAVGKSMHLTYRKDSLLGKYLWMHDTVWVADKGDLDTSVVTASALLGKPVDYVDSLDFAGTAPDRFDVILPDMRVNGIPYPGSVVHFQRKLGVFCVFMLVGNYQVVFIR